jgi:hypothetical protein
MSGFYHKQIGDKMKHSIYNNWDMLDGDETEKDLKEQIAERKEIEVEEVTEEDLSEEKSFLYDEYFNDELGNLDVELDGRIIAIADLGLWNGRVGGYKIGGTNLNEIMKMGNHDYIDIWSDGYNIRKSSSHHDGTNYILFRKVREDRDIDRFTDMIYNNKPISKSVLNYYTKSIEKDVRNIFGW